MRPRQLLLLLLALGLLVGLATAGGAAAAGNAGFAPPDSATASGSAINDLYWIVLGITGGVFLVVEGALVLFIFRFRRRRGQEATADGPQIHGNTRLELVWTAIPLLILIVIIVVTIVKVPSVEAKPAPGEDTLVVSVEAHQFYWQYEYENGVVTIDRLLLPVDRPVELVLDSDDVVHSWWVPELTGKRDAVPGRTNVLDFEPAETGTFRGQCAEFCGVEHAVMTTEVEVVPQAEFDSWLAGEADAQAAGTSDLGEEVWLGACAKCHGLAGEGAYGPPIAGNPTLTNPDELAALLADGRNVDQISGYMPPISAGWPDGQLEALLDYLAENLATASAGGEGG